jgi:predicted nucleotidyltransferase
MDFRQQCFAILPYILKLDTIITKMVTDKQKQDYGNILFGKTRRAVLTLLLGKPDESFYLREIVRLTGAGLGAVQREVKLLSEAGIILRTNRGNQVHYQANRGSPIFEELKNILASNDQSPSFPASSQLSPDIITQRFNLPQDLITEFCRRNHIRKLSLLGSILREDFRPDSDIDVLVEFEPGHTPGFGMVLIEDELSQLVSRKVDLRTPQELSRYFRDQVVREAKVLYE